MADAPLTLVFLSETLVTRRACSNPTLKQKNPRPPRQSIREAAAPPPPQPQPLPPPRLPSPWRDPPPGSSIHIPSRTSFINFYVFFFVNPSSVKPQVRPASISSARILFKRTSTRAVMDSGRDPLPTAPAVPPHTSIVSTVNTAIVVRRPGGQGRENHIR